MGLSDSPSPVPPRFVAFTQRLPPVRPSHFAPVACGRPHGHEPGSLVSRDPHRLLLRWRLRGLPGSWGDPRGPMPCSLTPAGLSPPGHYDGESAVALTTTWTTPAIRTFRGSITRLQPSLSTLRRRPHGMSPRKTRLRLVASLYRTGFAPAGSPSEGFSSVDLSPTSLPPPPGLAWRTVPGT